MAMTFTLLNEVWKMMTSYPPKPQRVFPWRLRAQTIDNIHGCDGLTTGVLRVGDGVADDVLKEDFEDATGLIVDEARDALHASATGETTDGGLGDALDVIAKDLAVTLGASLSQTFTSFSAT